MIFFLILIVTISIGKLGRLNEKVALICMQWPGQKAKKLFVILIINPCFFIQGQLKIIG